MRRWQAWTLHRRVLVASAAAVTFVIVLGVAAYATALDRVLFSAAQDAARVQAAEVASVIHDGEQPAATSLRDIPSQGSLLQVVDAQGQVVASSEESLRVAAVTALRPAPGVIDVDQVAGIPRELGEPYAIVVEGVRDPTGADYVVVVGTPLDVEATTVRTATVLLALGASALLALLLFLISRAVQQALRPVERIRSEVARITRVRGRGQITVPPTGDEIARLADTMNLMLARLEQSDATTRRFISDASHELRSPLATIRAAIEVSPADGSHPDPARDEVIHGEALRMQRLVDDLLTLAKADDGLPLSLEEVDVDDLLEAEVRRLRATGDVPVEATIAAARVMGDRAQLSQALRNLVDNAARHTEKGVQLAVSTTADEVVVTVDNDGPPIPDDRRQQVFDRFARLEESRERDSGGSGLGLAIVRTIVTAHGGSVRATATPAGQCRFEIRLPVSHPPRA